MRLLLDTSPFLWYISGDARLPGHVRALIQSADHEVWLNAVSLWEIAVKQQIGQYAVTPNGQRFPMMQPLGDRRMTPFAAVLMAFAAPLIPQFA